MTTPMTPEQVKAMKQKLRYTIGCPIHPGTTHEGCYLCRPMTYAQLAAENTRLNERVAALEAELANWKAYKFAGMKTQHRALLNPKAGEGDE